MRAAAQGSACQTIAEESASSAGAEKQVEPEFRFEEGAEGLAGGTTVRSQTRGIVATMRRRKWREGKVRPIPGSSPHDRLVSRVISSFVKGEFATIPSSPLLSAPAKNAGRPVCVFKACRNLSGPMTKHDQSRAGKDQVELPPTQIGRALQELGITWIPAYSPQAKGRVERGFLTAQDRLVKGMRVAGVTTLEQANHYLETEFLPWVNNTLAVAPANPDDAHRPLEKHHDLRAILSHVESRQVDNDYTIRLDNQIYQIARKDICSGLRKAVVRVEKRRDGSIAVRFRGRYLSVTECEQRPKVKPAQLAK